MTNDCHEPQYKPHKANTHIPMSVKDTIIDVAIYHTTKLRFLFETAKDFGRKF